MARSLKTYEPVRRTSGLAPPKSRIMSLAAYRGSKIMHFHRIAQACSVFAIGMAFAATAVGVSAAPPPPVNVTTYHNDNYRTGWNNAEPTLTPAKVSGGSFNLLESVALDDQVDAQPLVVANQTITGQGTHNVVYVATESDSIYAIDATSGAVLLQVSLGSPVPYTSLPGW